MKTVKVKQKKNEEKKDIAGRIVGLIFLALLIAVGYYMYDMFSPLRIDSDTTAGDWHHTAEMNEQRTEHWVFNNDGTAMSYTMNNETKTLEDKVTYNYYFRIAQETYDQYIEQGVLKKAASGGYEDSNGVKYMTLDQDKTQAEMVLTMSNVRKTEQKTITVRVTHLSKVEMDVIFINDRWTTQTTRLTKNLF